MFNIHQENKRISTLILWLGLIVVAIIIFLLGESFGYHKAEFSEHVGDNYNRIFEGHPPAGGGGPLPFPRDNMFTDAHGAYGTIVKVALPDIVIENTDGVEKTVVVGSDTMIKQFRNDAASTTLSLGQTVTVLGTPDAQGNIDAALIRIIPK